MNRLDVLDAIEKVRGEHLDLVVAVALDDLTELLDLRGGHGGPVVRASDPESARDGARAIEPKRFTRMAEVLDRLRFAQATGDGWVPAFELHTPACGGAEGLRRLRELRAQGWDIEVRRVGVGTETEYRLRGPA